MCIDYCHRCCLELSIGIFNSKQDFINPTTMPFTPEYAAKMASGSKDVPWFIKTPTELCEVAHELLEQYPHIPQGQVNQHVLDIRERAWCILPYPCIGNTAKHIELFSSLFSSLY